MQLKILKLGLLLILKIHRQIILARKIMKLVSYFFKITLYVMVPILKLFESCRAHICANFLAEALISIIIS